jgi:KipI family sensor histidine kinase inhibitor
MRLLAAGDAAILVEFEDPAMVLPFAAQARLHRLPAVNEIVPAEITVLIGFDPRLAGPGGVARWLKQLDPQADVLESFELVELDVRYDGTDLGEVAVLTGLSESEVVAAHTGQDWVVAFTGFAPGFGYLRGFSPGPDSERLSVPRRSEPRVRVPAGAVALAAGYTGIYPRVSPGGWQLIGHTDAQLWDVDRDPPALLRPGVRVRFRAG